MARHRRSGFGFVLERWRTIRSDHNARNLWSGRSSAFLGDQLHEIVFIWLVWDLTQSSTLTGMAVFVGRVPYWALGWWAGIYVDRMSRRHTIMIASMIGGLLTAIILIAYEVGALSVTLLMIIAFVITLVRSGENLAFTAQLPELVGRSTYLSLLAVMDNTKRIARLVGPLLGQCAGRNPYGSTFLYRCAACLSGDRVLRLSL